MKETKELKEVLDLLIEYCESHGVGGIYKNVYKNKSISFEVESLND